MSKKLTLFPEARRLMERRANGYDPRDGVHHYHHVDPLLVLLMVGALLALVIIRVTGKKKRD